MAYYYIDQSRDSDPHALADVEIFQTDENGYLDGEPFVLPHEPGEPAEGVALGWFYAYGMPGYLYDSEPVGPFDTEAEALAAAREAAGYCAHGVAEDGVCEECPAPELWVLRSKATGSFVEVASIEGVGSGIGLTKDTGKAAVWVSRKGAEACLRACGPEISAVPVRLSDADARRWGRS